MKKRLIGAFALALGIALVSGCSGKNSGQESQASDSQVQESQIGGQFPAGGLCGGGLCDFGEL